MDFVFSFFKPECKKKGLDLKIIKSLTDEETIINTDKEKFYAILINLVKNAIKFTEKGEIEFGYLKPGNADGSPIIQFYVNDTGIGIVKEKHHQVFERFIQVNNQITSTYEGSGLGLSITKAYINLLGGDIWLESEPGKGTQFFFTLPYPGLNHSGIIENPEQIEEIVTEVKPIKKQLKILIAEDDETSYDLLRLILKELKAEIFFTKNSKETIDCFLKQNDFDLILLDIRLPGKDGWSVSREIRKVDKEVVIIAQTAFALENDDKKAIESGCNDYIPKPIIKKQLITLIGKYFKL